MWLVKELLILLVLMIIKESVQQSTSPLSTKYQRVSVEANSFQSIRTTNLISQGLVREPCSYYLPLEHWKYHWKHYWKYYRSNTIMCSSMCTTNANCEAHYFEASQCHEANASVLVGSTSNLPTSKDVYIDQSVYMNNKGKCNKNS